MSGKGSKRRLPAVSEAELEANWCSINWQHPQHRLAQWEGKWYVIPADEMAVFVHWGLAMQGKRYKPCDFCPVPIAGPESVVFGEWREEPVRKP